MKLKAVLLALGLGALSNLSAQTKTIIVQVPPPPSVPLDGGLTALIGAGLWYGKKKINQKTKPTHDIH